MTQAGQAGHLAQPQNLNEQALKGIKVAAAEVAVAARLLRSSSGCDQAADCRSAPGRPGPRSRHARSCGTTPCPRNRRRAAASSTASRKASPTSWGQNPSHHADLSPGQGSGLRTDPVHPPDPAGNTRGDRPPATHVVKAAARWPDPAARDGKTWASACPILSRKSVAVTGIWADSGASVESCGLNLCATVS